MTADNDRPPILDYLDTVKISEIQVIAEDELARIIGPDMVDHLMGLLDRAVPEVYTPKRGTDDYRAMLEQGAQATEVESLSSGIGHLWSSYRWPGIVDFMELLVQRICTYASPPVQDCQGRPRINKIIKTEQDEADLMETAVAVSNEPGAAAQGLDFNGALETGKQLVRHLQGWLPVYQDALNACAAGDKELIRPLLVRLPGLRDDRDRVVQGTLVLALAAIAVSNPLAAMQNLLAYGTPESELLPVHMGTKGSKRRK